MKKIVWCALIFIGIFVFIWKVSDIYKQDLSFDSDYYFSIKSNAPQKMVYSEKIDDLCTAYHVVNFLDDNYYSSNIYYVYSNSKAFLNAYGNLKNKTDYNYDELWIRTYDSEGEGNYESYLMKINDFIKLGLYQMEV